jgi:tetratricopeptide (TPR) repeat protein
MYMPYVNLCIFLTILIICLYYLNLYYKNNNIFTSSVYAILPFFYYEISYISNTLNNINDTITYINGYYIDPVNNIFNIFFIGIILKLFIVPILILLIAFRFLPFFIKSNLIVEDFTNSTENDKISKMLVGMSQLFRERLMKNMYYVQSQVGVHVRKTERKDNMPLLKGTIFKGPSPENTNKQTLTSLMTSVSEFTPTYIKSLLPFADIILAPRGMKVSCILQSGVKSDNLGISLKISDIREKQIPIFCTIHESSEHKKKLSGILAKETVSDDDQRTKNIYERYVDLFEPTANCLALEISRMIMLDSIPLWYRIPSHKKLYQSYIYNFVGYLSLKFPIWGSFYVYQLAIKNLKTAIELYEDWFQPYENLGDTYSLWGQVVQGEEGVNLQQEAVVQYKKALDKTKYIKNSSEIVMLKNRINVSIALADLLTGKEEKIKNAKLEIKKIVEIDNYLLEEKCARTLYNLACWYSIAKDKFNETEQKDVVKRAHIFLAFSLVRDQDELLWNQVDLDRDLVNIRPFERITELIRPLAKDPKLANKPEEFKNKMNEVFQQYDKSYSTELQKLS